MEVMILARRIWVVLLYVMMAGITANPVSNLNSIRPKKLILWIAYGDEKSNAICVFACFFYFSLKNKGRMRTFCNAF